MAMDLNIHNSFIETAMAVIEKETRIPAQKGKLALNKSAILSNDINVLIGVTGKAVGNVLFSMDSQTALAIASGMMEEEFTEIDDVVKSTIGELANVITGRGARLLEDHGFPVTISPPVLLMGRGARIENVNLPRFEISLQLNLPRVDVPIAVGPGHFLVSLSLKEAD